MLGFWCQRWDVADCFLLKRAKRSGEAHVRKLPLFFFISIRVQVSWWASSFSLPGNKDLASLRESLAEAQTKYKSVLAYFCQPDTLLPKDFFSFWHPFCRDFKELWRKEIAKRQREKWVAVVWVFVASWKWVMFPKCRNTCTSILF